MNFLAHAFLAGEDAALQVGGLAGDFVKGPLPAGLPSDLAAGVRLHRQIDVFADLHPAFLRSRARMSPARRRVAGILVDMFYDHFLAEQWAQFHPQALPQFTQRVYQNAAEREAELPARFGLVLERMRADDWLASYRDPDIIALAVNRMAARMKYTHALHGGAQELLNDYAGFAADFAEFLPAARCFAAQQAVADRLNVKE